MVNKDGPFPPHNSAFTLMNLKYIWMNMTDSSCLLKMVVGQSNNITLPTPFPNKGLTHGTNQQPCGRQSGVYLIRNPCQPNIKIAIDDIKEVFLAKEWNSFHLSRNKLDYLHLRKFLKYKCECT